MSWASDPGLSMQSSDFFRLRERTGGRGGREGGERERQE